MSVDLERRRAALDEMLLHSPGRVVLHVPGVWHVVAGPLANGPIWRVACRPPFRWEFSATFDPEVEHLRIETFIADILCPPFGQGFSRDQRLYLFHVIEDQNDATAAAAALNLLAKSLVDLARMIGGVYGCDWIDEYAGNPL